MTKKYLIFTAFCLSFFCTLSADAAFFQMKDGSYYDPSTGLVAPTVDALTQLIAAKQGVPVVTSPDAPIVVTLPPQDPTTVPVVTPPVTVTPSTLDQFPLKQAIRTAQAHLRNLIVLEKGTKPAFVSSDTDWRPVTLAIWNKKTLAIEYEEIKKKGTQVKVVSGAFTPYVVVSNGVNTAYRFSDTDLVVVAVRYPLYKDVGSKKKPKFAVEEVVYSPLSQAVTTPEMVALGKSLFEGYLSEAYAYLENNHVPSRAFPDKQLHQILDKDTAKSVFLIEHADSGELKRSPQATVERFYVTIAANEKDAYDYSGSTAGALGLAQFIPSTYTKFVKIRPELGLIPGFEAGMRDPVNAMKAEVGYLDYLIDALPNHVQAASDLEQLHEFAVAAYNGGPSRVSKAIAEWEQGLNGARAKQVSSLTQKTKDLTKSAAALKKKILAEDDPDVWKPLQKKLNAMRVELANANAQLASLGKSSLRRETVDYIIKYRLAMDWFAKEQTSVSSIPTTTVASL